MKFLGKYRDIKDLMQNSTVYLIYCDDYPKSVYFGKNLHTAREERNAFNKVKNVNHVKNYTTTVQEELEINYSYFGNDLIFELSDDEYNFHIICDIL